jgi:Ion channel
MRFLAVIAGILLILGVLWEAFETVILPRRVTRPIRLTSLFYRAAWQPWVFTARRLTSDRSRDKYLALFGPLSLFMLLSLWAVVLITGYALVQWGIPTRLNVPQSAAGFDVYVYFSGVTFFTLGYGDIAPVGAAGRIMTVIEAGTGLGLLAVVIGYLPVLYQSFSRREVSISLLDARAGSPSSATELLRRHASSGNLEELGRLLREWELWAAELLESHLSYPVLSFFRSQHDNQSWLAALTTVLDTCALVIVGVDGTSAWQARLTFAMARHAVVDIAQIFSTAPSQAAACASRLPDKDLVRVREILAASGATLNGADNAVTKLRELRLLYEPYVHALSQYLLMPLPPWILPPNAIDNWKTSAWGRIL